MHFPPLKARSSSLNRRIQWALTALFLLTLTFFIPSSAHAQYRASIQGTVTDPSGAVVADATVTAINVATGVSTTRTTMSNGFYVISP